MGNSSSHATSADYSIRAPYDPNDKRFIKSFRLEDDVVEVQKFYQKYGFVIFDNVLNEEEVNHSIDDLWGAFPGAQRNDPSTWSPVRHPFGFAGEEPIDGLQLWKNRQHTNVYHSFKLAYEASKGSVLKEPLVACLDRGNIMLPTTGPLGRKEFEAHRLPHFDLNPYIWCGMGTPDPDLMQQLNFYEHYHLLLSEGNNTTSHGWPKLRAVLNLSESTDHTGGFECLAGFHNQLQLWCQLNPVKVQAQVSHSPYGWGVDSDGPIDRNMQKITSRKGSIIVFSAELPHSMFPNESEGFRYAQYLRMAPLSTLELTEETKEMRKRLLEERLPKELEVTDIGREVFLLN
jgi:hypothetical protein